MFLTTTSLSNFYSPNLYLATIFLSINILVVPLSKSTLTVISSCISVFSIPIFNYISLNILNVLLMSLWITFSFTALFGTPVYAPLCYTFPSIGYAATSQFHHSFFFPVLYSGHRISPLSYSNTLSPIVSFLPYFIHYTLIISPLLASSFLQFHASWQRSYYIFFTCPLRKKPYS